jgi:hypothetical protein
MASSYPAAIDTLDPVPATLAGPVTHEELHEQLINAVLAIQNTLGVNFALGRIGYADVTANQTGLTTTADLTSLSVTWTAVAGRRYRITGSVLMQSGSANDYGQLQIADGSNTVKTYATFTAAAGSNDYAVFASEIVSGISGSTTRKLRAGRAGGSSGTWQMSASGTRRAYILVEDIGT